MTNWRLRWQGTLVVLLVLAAWEVVSRTQIVRPLFFPAVTTIFAALWSLTVSLDLVKEYGVTLWRAGVGFASAAAMAIVMGVLMGYYRSVFNVFEPLIEMLRPIPTVAIIPVAILLLGIEHAMKVIIIFWACFFPIWINTVESVRAVDRELIDTARTFKLNDVAIIKKILIPFAAPGMFTGMRISLAYALILSVVSEMVAGDTGVGYFLLDSERAFRTAHMYAGVFSLCVVGYLLNRAFVAVERRVLRWHSIAYAQTIF